MSQTIDGIELHGATVDRDRTHDGKRYVRMPDDGSGEIMHAVGQMRQAGWRFSGVFWDTQQLLMTTEVDG